MKTNSLEYAELPRVALWTGLAVGLGIVVHNVFFLIAAMIALTVPFRWLRAALPDGGIFHPRAFRGQHQHRILG